MRADQLLVVRHLANSRSQAQRLISGGVEWLQGESWRRVTKNGDEVSDAAAMRLLDDSEARYVSRGGLKLEAALKQAGLRVAGLQCLDVGQSTGGFTDCLLQQGAALVVGVDVGSAQLHPRLRADPRVLCIENTNARRLLASDLVKAYADWMAGNAGKNGPSSREQRSDPGSLDCRVAGAPRNDTSVDYPSYHGMPSVFLPEFDLIVADLSFISQTLVLPALAPLLKSGGALLTLVKPQFELQPGQVGKCGIVKDASLHLLVERRLREACAALGLTVNAWFDSPIAGGDGNREFFIYAGKL